MTKRLFRSVLLCGLGLFLMSLPVHAQTGRSTGTTRSLGSTSLRGSTGVSQANAQVGTVLTPADFGASGSGNLLRSAIAGQTMGFGGNGFNQFGRGFGNQFGGGFGNQFGNQFGQQQQQQGRTQLKIPLRLGVEDLPRRAVAGSTGGSVRAASFEQRLTRLPGLEQLNSVVATLDGRTVVLTGTVPSARDRDLLTRLALLEPGVDEVQNDLRLPNERPAASNRETLPVPR